MKKYLEELKKEDKKVEIWYEKFDEDDDGIIAGKILRVYDDGVLVKEEIKQELGTTAYRIFIPFRVIVRIIE